MSANHSEFPNSSRLAALGWKWHNGLCSLCGKWWKFGDRHHLHDLKRL